MYTYIYIYTYIHIYTYICIHTHVCVCTTYIYIYLNTTQDIIGLDGGASHRRRKDGESSRDRFGRNVRLGCSLAQVAVQCLHPLRQALQVLVCVCVCARARLRADNHLHPMREGEHAIIDFALHPPQIPIHLPIAQHIPSSRRTLRPHPIVADPETVG